MLRDGLRTFFFQRVLDHIMAFGLMFLLGALAIHSYGKVRLMAEVCARVASQNDLRLDVQYHYALTGEWPEDMDGLLRARSGDVPYVPFEGDWVRLEGGAISIYATQGMISGQTISLRPAFPAGDGGKSLCWVVGPVASDGKRLVLGADATTLAASLIPAPMR